MNYSHINPRPWKESLFMLFEWGATSTPEVAANYHLSSPQIVVRVRVALLHPSPLFPRVGECDDES